MNVRSGKQNAIKKILDGPFIDSLADVARELGITRARVSQVMSLLKLAPEIQKELLSLSRPEGNPIFPGAPSKTTPGNKGPGQADNGV